MTGNPVSELHNPRFLLDESLTPAVADALRLVGYDIQDVVTVLDPDRTRGSESIKDPKIIDWCQESGAVWIHADDRAKKEHGALMLRSGIRTLWVIRPSGRMTGREQLRILAFVLPKLLDNYAKQPRRRHYRATATNPLSTPSLRHVEIRA